MRNFQKYNEDHMDTGKQASSDDHVTSKGDRSDDVTFQEQNRTAEQEIGLHVESDGKNPVLTEELRRQNE